MSAICSDAGMYQGEVNRAVTEDRARSAKLVGDAMTHILAAHKISMSCTFPAGSYFPFRTHIDEALSALHAITNPKDTHENRKPTV